MKKKVVAVALVALLLSSTTSPSLAAKVSAKKLEKATPLVGLTEVQILNSSKSPTDGGKIKLSGGSSNTARVKVGENFQLSVPGLWPNLISLPILVGPTGMSANLTSSVPDLDGTIILPYLRIMKKGNYTLIIRQPDEPQAVMAKIKVY